MPVRPVPLRSPLVLVSRTGLQSQLADLAERDGFPQSPYDIEDDLNALSQAGGVPVTLSEPLAGKTAWSVLVHTRRYLVRLFVTGKYGDAYSIASIAPLRLRDHQRLAQGYLLTRPRGWLVVDSTQEIPRDAQSGWEAFVAGWDDLTASLAVTARPTGRQDAFLGTLGDVIDATEDITTDSEAAGSYPYREVRPTAGARSGATQSYEFVLAAARAPDENAFVQVVTRAGQGSGTVKARGQVTRVSGMAITIRFDEPVSWGDLQGQGEITVTASTVVFRMQREALGQLRTGRARNPGVLAALVDGQAQPLSPAQRETAQRPAFSLNAHQREVFDKAYGRPDLLAVIGPPGTGKTTTITEIVRSAAGRGERVVVCSQNNRAVDNVLGRLPGELLAVRVGNESRITAEGMPYLLQRQAADLRTQALSTSRGNLDAYGGLGGTEGWTSELTRRNAILTAARDVEAAALTRLDAARRAVGGPVTEEVDRLTAAHAVRELETQRSAERAQRLRQLSDRAEARAAGVIIGWAFGPLSRRWSKKSDAERSRLTLLASALHDAQTDLQAARRHLADITKDVPAVVTAKTAADTAATQAGQERTAAQRAARSALETVAPLGMMLPLVDDGEDAALVAAERWLVGWLPVLAARRDLLAEWIDEASGDSSQLYPELLRYADVLASTCTGAGSRPELADLDFDLAIVDEAGQIGVADALIPLVRARRAILVGDHMQLPPFLDSEVDVWGKRATDPVVQDMLKMSALEMVVNALPPASPNVVWLTEQHRMPEVIAKFASMQFYAGRLETPPGLRQYRDELFRSALAFVDTSALPWPERRDRSGQDRERWGQRGYDNPAEARLLADLAVHYDHAHRDWGVIVPYLAQAERIRRLLAGRVGDAEKVRLNVGTVDSFQGGERDVILYGFTRSNPERRVGFLKELRRVNVAITRARLQLVLVGDLDTLTQARDKGFRQLARSLRDYVAGAGEIVPHDAARGRLQTEGTEQ